jgi:hypothetical protein
MVKQVLEGIFFRGNGTTTVRAKIPYETSNYSAASTKANRQCIFCTPKLAQLGASPLGNILTTKILQFIVHK